MSKFDNSSELIRSLSATLTKRRLLSFFSGLLLSGAAALALVLSLSALASLFILPVWVKLTLMVSGSVGCLYLFVRYSIMPFKDGSIESVASDLEDQNRKLKGRLVAAVQFAQEAYNNNFSKELVTLNEKQALAEAGQINFNEVLTFYPLWRTGRYLIGSTALALAALIMLPGFFSYSYEVFSNPTEEIAPPLGYEIVVNPGTTEWVKYRDLTIGGAVVGFRLPDNAKLHYRLADGNWQTSEIDLSEQAHQAVTAGDSVSFGLILRELNRSLDYWVEAGRLKSEIYQIDIVDRPRVSAIELSLFYPDYTGLDPLVIDENNGSFSAVIGTRVSLRIKTNLPVQSAEILFSDSSRTPMRIDEFGAQTSLLVDNSRIYQFDLLDHLGEKNPDPIEYYITAVPDEYPAIDVLYPGFNVNLTEDLSLPLKLHIYDDFGFSSLVLKYSLVSQGQSSDESVAVLHFSDDIKTEGEIEFNWDLSRFDLYPGDYITYYFEVADNDLVTGPKVTASKQFVARLPSLDEILAQTEMESSQRIEDTEQLLNKGAELSRQLEETMRKIESQQGQRPQKAEWQQQKELESIADKNLEMMKETERLAQEMSQSLDKMQDNAQMSRQIMDRLAEIQKLFEDVATPEMREAQKKLAEAMEKMNPDELREALKNFEMTQDDLLQRLERTLALLKKLQVEQKMEAMVRQAEQLMERQAEVNEKTEAADEESLPKFSRAEKSNQESMEDLKEQVAELDSLIKDAEMEASKDAAKFAEAVSKTDADKNMKEMADALKQGDKESSQKQGSEAQKKLADMLGKMQEQLANMQGGDNEKMLAALRRSIRDANSLSKNQEATIEQASELTPNSAVVRELALIQQDIKAACDGLGRSISELGKESPYVAAELTQLLNRATTSMSQAVNELDAKRSSQAKSYQKSAMGLLNQVSLRLFESMDEQQECQNPKDSDQANKIQSLCNKQNKLNQKTKKQCDNPSLSNSGGKQLNQMGQERLSTEQAGIRKSLQDLEREFGHSRQILGRLNDIADEMKKVEDELASGNAGEETMQRQLKIYSRMLEASRSLQRKDYNDQRQAQTATGNMFYAPPELSSGLFDDQNGLDEQLQKYLGDDYPPQYEDQIKAYFRALLQLQYRLNGDN